MTNSYKLILETLERMVNDRGLALRLDHVGVDPEKEEAPELASLEYVVWKDPNTPIDRDRAEGAIYIIQNLSMQFNGEPEALEGEIRKSNNVYSLEELLPHYSPVPMLVVTFTNPAGGLKDEINMKLSPDGRIESNAVALAGMTNYVEAFSVMLDMLQGTPTS